MIFSCYLYLPHSSFLCLEILFCHTSKSNSLPGIQNWAAIVVIVVPIVLLLGLLVALALFNPKWRKKLFPYRDRDFYEAEYVSFSEVSSDRSDRRGNPNIDLTKPTDAQLAKEILY